MTMATTQGNAALKESDQFLPPGLISLLLGDVLNRWFPIPISSSNPTITPKSRTFVNSCFSPWFHSFIYTLPCPRASRPVFFVVVLLLLLLLHCPSESGEGVFSPKPLIALDWPRARTFLPLPDADHRTTTWKDTIRRRRPALLRT